MLESKSGSPNGIKVMFFEKGKEYVVNESLADNFVNQQRVAEIVEIENVVTKTVVNDGETKMELKSSYENKSEDDKKEKEKKEKEPKKGKFKDSMRRTK
jgi:hypothetical protein